MSDKLHLLIPFAASSADGCREALRGLRLPHLQALLARLLPQALEAGDETTLSMPHERALARECGLAGGDGQLPWAAWAMRQGGQDPGSRAWAWITPCHWRVATDHIMMSAPHALGLDERGSQTLLTAMRPYFAEDGIELDYEAPARWRAHGEVFRPLATASLDRVAGRDVDPWMPRAPAAALLRRLQQEMQMLLYTHPLNDERGTRGLLPVNSFWASGAGALPANCAAAPPAGLHIDDSLREAALRGDWPAWAEAWRQLDAGEGARLLAALGEGRPVALTLCGERGARTWAPGPGALWRRAAHLLRPQPVARWLEPL